MKNKLITTILAAAIASSGSALLAADDHDHGTQNIRAKPSGPMTVKDDDHGDKENHDGHKHDKEEVIRLTPEAARTHGITIQKAQRQQLNSQLIVPARVAFNADAMSHVGSPVRGRVIEIKVKLGQSVRQGDELVIIESPELGEVQSELIQRRAELAVAEASVEPAKEAYERGQALFDENQGIALAEVQKRKADWRAAEGAVHTSAAGVAASENKLHLLGMTQTAISDMIKTKKIQPRYVLRAPIAGQIIQRELTHGELVNPDRDALIVIADTATLWVWADVPEIRMGDIRENASATIHAASLREPVAGKTTFISPALDPNTRTARVRIDVSNQQGLLRPGMFTQARIAGPASDSAALAVPEDAVQNVEGVPVVFVPVNDTTFAKRNITAGASVGGMIPVLSGLKEGESFVAAGSFILKADLGKAGAAHEH